MQNLANINPFSEIASDNGSIFRAVTTANNQMLVSRVGENPTWNSAVDGILGRPLEINSVETQQIQNGSFNANYFCWIKYMIVLVSVML